MAALTVSLTHELGAGLTGQGRSEMRSLAFDLAPSERQVDLSVSYQAPMGENSELLVELVHARNCGNRAGMTDNAAVPGMRWSF